MAKIANKSAQTKTSLLQRRQNVITPRGFVYAFLAVVLGIGIYNATRAATAAIVSINPTPTKVVLNQIKLQDITVMQSFAYDPVHKFWIFAQVTQGGRHGKNHEEHSVAGDITLTKISPTGKKLGYMYLQGFGHGTSIGVEPVGAKTFVYTEANPQNGSGTAIARFEWRNGATLKRTDATVYGVNAGARFQSPYVDAANNLIGVRYYSETTKGFRWAIYRLNDFKARNYTPLSRITRAEKLRGVFQGWALNGTSGVIEWSGEAYTETNLKPGNATLRQLDSSGQVIAETLVTHLPDLTHREAEGVTAIDGNLCLGMATGEPGDRRANVWCQRSL